MPNQTKTVRVEVTQEDIDTRPELGNWCHTCPLARAISRALGIPVSVGMSEWNDGHKLPDAALEFRRAFDDSYYDGVSYLVPFSFDLEVPA